MEKLIGISNVYLPLLTSLPIDGISIILIIMAVLFGILAVFVRETLIAAISLAALSATIALIFFRMSSPYAGVFELSVGAGLITALFISTLALVGRGFTGGKKDE
jgi:uncharacterized MnhB-related membrane protein